MYACNGILFNHESPLRPGRFVTQKIVSSACRIANGSAERLLLGRLDVARDWGWAPDYVDAMHRMLQLPTPQDMVIATGQTHTLEDFVAATFSALQLDWRDHVDQSDALMRPNELQVSCADPSLAARTLNWRAQHGMREVVHMLVDAARQSTHNPSS